MNKFICQQGTWHNIFMVNDLDVNVRHISYWLRSYGMNLTLTRGLKVFTTASSVTPAEICEWMLWTCQTVTKAKARNDESVENVNHSTLAVGIP